jgi:hypothetical protein
MAKRLVSGYSEIGCRIPKDYFWVIGWGESDVGIELARMMQPLHMGRNRELQRRVVFLGATA